jgi:hypothetical protein
MKTFLHSHFIVSLRLQRNVFGTCLRIRRRGTNTDIAYPMISVVLRTSYFMARQP